MSRDLVMTVVGFVIGYGCGAVTTVWRRTRRRIRLPQLRTR
jgi:hypothetical protein